MTTQRKPRKQKEDDLRPEYDLKSLGPPVRGKYYQRAQAKYPHIELEAGGVPRIAGTTMKVVEVVLAQQAHGWSPEEIHFQHPYLSLAQIHSALAYYWDHKAELDADLARRSERIERIQREVGPSSLREKLRARSRPA